MDDFLVTGPKGELVELRRQLQRDYEVEGDILGLAAALSSGPTIQLRDGGVTGDAHGVRFVTTKRPHSANSIQISMDSHGFGSIWDLILG